jgi:hypothetical protein
MSTADIGMRPGVGLSIPDCSHLGHPHPDIGVLAAGVRCRVNHAGYR